MANGFVVVVGRGALEAYRFRVFVPDVGPDRPLSGTFECSM